MKKIYPCKMDKPCAKENGCKKNGGFCNKTSDRKHAVTTKSFMSIPEHTSNKK